MAERYRVTLHSQMGPREGLLTLEHTGSYVSGSLELMGFVPPADYDKSIINLN